ncbi:MAG: hypothetical protein QOC80_1481 [Frankiaceae bacterium]|nr:hypothetical protein [Frankiaceae bacterium]
MGTSRRASGRETRPRGERAVLALSSLLLWVPCALLLVVGAPLWVAGLLAISAGGMTMQVVETSGVTGRLARWARRIAGS